MTAEMSDPVCTCGHMLDTHQHFRPGTDCGECGKVVCPAFTLRVVPDARPAPQTGLSSILARLFPPRRAT